MSCACKNIIILLIKKHTTCALLYNTKQKFYCFFQEQAGLFLWDKFIRHFKIFGLYSLLVCRKKNDWYKMLFIFQSIKQLQYVFPDFQSRIFKYLFGHFELFHLFLLFGGSIVFNVLIITSSLAYSRS
jgi:hypothetical protein